MLAYYLRLGFLQLRSSPLLTALMVLTLAVGIAASMSTFAILYAMSGDPIPHKSDRLFVPLLDVRPADEPDSDPEPPTQLTYRDAMALRAADNVLRRTAIIGISPAVEPNISSEKPFFAHGAAVDADFFAMFEVPLVAGGPWSRVDDERGAKVVVLRESLARRTFGGADPIGKSLVVAAEEYVVSGVVDDDWQPLPRF